MFHPARAECAAAAVVVVVVVVVVELTMKATVG